MKQQSLEIMRSMKPDQSYPHKRLTLPSGVQRIDNLGMPMVYLPNGEWTTSGDKDVPITENLVTTFSAMGLELDTDLRPVHPLMI
jgi:hypothetical protein